METKNDPVLELAGDWKKVMYFGHEFIVPEWVKWISIDADGRVFGFDCKPSAGDCYWSIEYGSVLSELPVFRLKGINWRETLREV